MYSFLSIDLSNKVDLFLLGFISLAFLVFGLFLGKNNATQVQKIGEEVSKDASKAKDAIESDIKKING